MKRIIRLGLVASMFLLAIGMLPVPVSAHNGVDHSTERETRQHETVEREQAQTRLDDAKKRVCELRAQNINALMTRSVFRAENYGKMLSTATERVKTFAQNNPGDYQDLIAAIDAQSAAFTADFATLKNATFSCDSEDPKGQIVAFQEAHKAVMQDLKDWRMALRNLISSLKTDSQERQ